MHYEVVDPASDDAVWCLREYYDELDSRFVDGFDPGPFDETMFAGLREPSGAFVLVYDDQGRAVGCGGLQVIGAGIGEIKRVWVSETARGQGVASGIVAWLEARAASAGYDTIRLDTNGVLTEAHALYRRHGYVEIDRYNDNPYAELFFEKHLGSADTP